MQISEESQFVYIGDPMCSWCWGFVPELNQIIERFESQFRFRILVGGLRPGNTETMDQSTAHMLQHHWDEVHKASGQPFCYDILESRDFIYDTEPPCRAVATCRELLPGKEWDFFKKIQHAFYAENKDTNKLETYKSICEDLNFNTDAFEKAFYSEKMKDLVQQEFYQVQKMGITGFPTLMLLHKKTPFLLARGYTPAPTITGAIEEILNNSPQDS